MGRTRGASRGEGRAIRVRQPPFTGYLEVRAGGAPNLVLAVGRRAGSATVRNRTKRVLRNVFRGNQQRIPVGALVTITAGGDLTRTPRRSLRLAAGKLLERLIREWETLRPSPGTPDTRSWPSSACTS